ncbi:hypothetical protein OV090_10220 [Nannocystis sp. RBIL2]|uniref:hypothetical protein n=1 Tax=Nannocystis sp. RBIL2 TaxID=2996788 RepID=UPI002270FE4B|nr:hypothetical protein [Nannocystis sp. RBIL2]MCY1065138.1 hypothetical protein [Nannocystis sp. RBIL2]
MIRSYGVVVKWQRRGRESEYAMPAVGDVERFAAYGGIGLTMRERPARGGWKNSDEVMANVSPKLLA